MDYDNLETISDLLYIGMPKEASIVAAQGIGEGNGWDLIVWAGSAGFSPLSPLDRIVLSIALTTLNISIPYFILDTYVKTL